MPPWKEWRVVYREINPDEHCVLVKARTEEEAFQKGMKKAEDRHGDIEIVDVSEKPSLKGLKI